MARIPMDPFDNNMDDIFSNLMGDMGSNRRYMINGQEVSPEDFAKYQRTGKLPADVQKELEQRMQQQGMQAAPGQGGKKESILKK